MTSPDWPQEPTDVIGWLRGVADHLATYPHLIPTVGDVVHSAAPYDRYVTINHFAQARQAALTWLETLADPVVTIGYVASVGGREIHLHLTGAMAGGHPVTVVVMLRADQAQRLAQYVAVETGAVVPPEVVRLTIAAPLGQLVDGQPETVGQGDLDTGQAGQAVDR